MMVDEERPPSPPVPSPIREDDAGGEKDRFVVVPDEGEEEVERGFVVDPGADGEEDADGAEDDDDGGSGSEYDAILPSSSSAAAVGGGGGGPSPSGEEKSKSERRRGRYCCSHLRRLCGRACAAAAVAGLAAAGAVIYAQRLRELELEALNAELANRTAELEERVELLRKGVMDDMASRPFVREEISCGPLAALELDREKTEEEEDDDDDDPALFGAGGCVSNAAPATLLSARRSILSWEGSDGDSSGAKSAAGGAASTTTPSWIERRIPYYGVWLYPALKLVLLSCPQCEVKRSRTMLTMLSSMAHRNHGSGSSGGSGSHAEDEGSGVGSLMNWTSKLRTSRDAWDVENDYSYRLSGSFGLNLDEDGDGAARTFHGGDKATVEAFRLVNSLRAEEGWFALAVVRHPHDRLADAYASLEDRWSKADADDDDRIEKILGGRPFYKMESGSTGRAKSFWADFVLGRLDVPDEGQGGGSGCSVPSVPGLHQLVPIASGYWRDGLSRSPGSYYAADHVVSADLIHPVWPELLEFWGFDRTDEEMLELVDVHLGGGGGAGGGGGSSSAEAEAVRTLLREDAEFRTSVDRFYGQDFSCFGFERREAAVSARPTEFPTSAPTSGPTGAPTAGPTALPRAEPTAGPTAASAPSDAPSAAPTDAAGDGSMAAPSAAPSGAPGAAPTGAASGNSTDGDAGDGNSTAVP